MEKILLYNPRNMTSDNILETVQDRGIIMSPIEWHQQEWPWVTLKVTFAIWSLSNSHTSGTYHPLTPVYLHVNPKLHVPCNFNCYIEIEDFSRLQAVTYTEKVVIS